MKIAIIGTGNVGTVLGRRLAGANHEVSFVSRDPSREALQELRSLPGVVAIEASIQHTIGKQDLLIYAAPYTQAQATLTAVESFHNTILIDCTNPLNRSFDGLDLLGARSAGEAIAGWARDARVVKAFNTSSVAAMNDPSFSGQMATQFYCGDDIEAKQVVASLIRDLQMEPVDAGPLSNSQYLESMAMLYIHSRRSRRLGRKLCAENAEAIGVGPTNATIRFELMT